MIRRLLFGWQIFFCRRSIRGWWTFLFHLDKMIGGRRRQISLVWRLVRLTSSVGELTRAWTWDVFVTRQKMSRVARDMVTSPSVLAGVEADVVAAIEAAEPVTRAVAVGNSGAPALGGGGRAFGGQPLLVVGASRWMRWGEVGHVVRRSISVLWRRHMGHMAVWGWWEVAL